MEVRELIEAIRALEYDERWADELRRELDALDFAFKDQSRRLTMTAADLERAYEI